MNGITGTQRHYPAASKEETGRQEAHCNPIAALARILMRGCDRVSASCQRIRRLNELARMDATALRRLADDPAALNGILEVTTGDATPWKSHPDNRLPRR